MDVMDGFRFGIGLIGGIITTLGILSLTIIAVQAFLGGVE